MEVKKHHIIFLVLGASALVVYCTGGDEVPASVQEKSKVISVKELAYKSKKGQSLALSKKLMALDDSETQESVKRDLALREEKSFLEKRQAYFDKFNLSQKEFSLELKRMREEHKELIDHASTRGITLKEIDYLSPEMLYYVSNFLNKEARDLTEEDLRDTDFASEDWLYVKTFVSSKDFDILLSQNRLGGEETTPSYLKGLYQSNGGAKREALSKKRN